MKNRLWNLLLFVTVGAALFLSLQSRDGLPLPAGDAPVFAAVSSPTPHPLDVYRASRQESRLQQQQALLALTENPDMEASLRARAGEQLLSLTREWEWEEALEAALSAQGHGRALCIIEKERLTILISGALTPEQMALIAHLAQEIAGILPENIRISPC